MIYIKREKGNPEVTNYYLDIIGSALIESQYDRLSELMNSKKWMVG